MAIADTITSMQTHTSNAYTMIGYGTDLTGINKNLENLSSSIFNAFLEALRTPDTLFNNLPKITGSGANITLNDTANAPMRIELGASELSQSATPTPSSPQDIHTISGSNKVVVSNSDNTISQEADIDLGHENLANITSFSAGNRTEVYNNTCYFKNGTYSTASSVVLYLNNQTDLILKANQTYTISVICNGKVTASTYKVIYLKIGGQSTINMGSLGSNKRINYQYTPTADEPIKFISFDMGTNQTFEDYSVNIQVDKGSTAHSYTEYGKAIEYCKIGNYEDKFIRNSGKNLFNGTFNHLAFYDTAVGESMSFTESSNYLGAYCKVEAGKTYSISKEGTTNRFRIAVSTNIPTNSGTGLEIGRDDSATKIENITIPSGYNYLSIYLSNSSGSSTGINIMINEGNTALDYEPYGSNEWYIKKNIGKVVLDGTENWASYLSATDKFYCTDKHFGKTGGYELTSNYLCDYFQSAIFTGVNNAITGTMYATYVSITDDNVNSEATFKTWLSSHNTTIYYQLNTPTYTKITGTLETQLENIYQKLLSYSGTTNISQANNDLSFNLSVQAIEDL